MSPMIMHARDLQLPDEVELDELLRGMTGGHDKVAAFSTRLTDAGKEALSRDLLKAVVAAKAEDNLRPIQETIEAWYRTYLFARDPQFMVDLARVAEDDEPLTREQIRNLLRIS